MRNIILSAILLLSATTIMAQQRYAKDRVYTGNQVSNTVSVIDPSTNKLLGEIVLGKPQPNIFSPLYKGQALVHGLGYSPIKKMLAVVAIGSNSINLVSTEDNNLLKTIYTGRSPHEATFKPDGSEIWTTVRGEAYVSVIDVDKMEEVRKVPVSDGPGMVAFTPDSRFAYVCSSFTPIVDVVDTKTYEVIKRIVMPSPFSPNIFASPDGKLIALSLKDIGNVVVINTKTNEIVQQFATGPITNHVSFTVLNGKLLMPVTVGGENCIKIYDVADNYKQIATIPVGQLPHGLWAAPDGKRLYVGLEYADQVQPIDMETMKALTPIQTGQSPQALLYAANAVTNGTGMENLKPLQDSAATQVVVMSPLAQGTKMRGELSVRTIGVSDLVEQLFLNLKPNTAYTLALSRSDTAPYSSDYEINSFVTDDKGKYAGQSTGLIRSHLSSESPFKNVVLVEVSTNQLVMVSRHIGI